MVEVVEVVKVVKVGILMVVVVLVIMVESSFHLVVVVVVVVEHLGGRAQSPLLSLHLPSPHPLSVWGPWGWSVLQP